jgi:EAL domain-containing protein (putative c-di-GMP-specific phosphodiesterase class I)
LTRSNKRRDSADALPSAPFGSRLSTLLPWLVRLTLGFTLVEAVAGVTTRDAAFLAATGLTGGFLLVLLSARYVARSGDDMRATWLVAAGLGVLAVVAGYAIADVGQAMVLLPVLAFALILPFASGPHVRAIIALTVLDSVAVLIAVEADHPLALPAPVAGLFSSAILVAVAALIVVALIDFASSARRSLADVLVMHEHQDHRAEERTAVLRLLGALDSSTAGESGSAPELVAGQIVASLARLPGIDLVEILELDDGRLRFLAIQAPKAFGLRVGESLPAARTAAILSRASSGIWSETIVPDTGDAALPIELIGIRAAAFAPLRVGGVLLGVLGIGTADPHHAEHIIGDIPAVGEFGAAAVALLGPHLLARREGRHVGEDVAAIIGQRAYRSRFQPIVDLRSGAAVGYEALTTFRDGRSPTEVFAMAARHGFGRQLELATLGAAIRSSDRLPPGAFLSLNVSPDLALDPALGVLFGKVRRPIVLEITEHVVIADYPGLRTAARSLGPNVSLAVDDAGAGIANFNHLVELRPAYIKVDIGLVRDVDVDLPRQALLVGLLHFANQSGSTVVAEGLETPAERDTVVRLGVSLGQGYLLGRPASAGSWSAESVAPVDTLPTLLRPFVADPLLGQTARPLSL